MADTAILYGPDGTPIQEKTTEYLSLEDAELLRAYVAWATGEGFQAELICADCGQPAECFVQGDIGIFCPCRVQLWKAS